jgi:hypothetical protein
MIEQEGSDVLQERQFFVVEMQRSANNSAVAVDQQKRRTRITNMAPRRSLKNDSLDLKRG